MINLFLAEMMHSVRDEGSVKVVVVEAAKLFNKKEILYNKVKTVKATMSLACLVCHSVESPSPSHSFRSSVSTSENEGRCYAIANCLTRKLSVQSHTTNSFLASTSSKVTPQPAVPDNSEIPGAPRLVRSRAVRRDLVRDWNFDEVVMA